MLDNQLAELYQQGVTELTINEDNNKRIEIINKIVPILNKATIAYDEGLDSGLTDMDWDKFYFLLVQLEQKTGYYCDNSPTQKINYNTVSKLNKVKHNHKMLSLQKTKDINTLLNFSKSVSDSDYCESIILMNKLDGLTCSLSYQDGYLVRAETRGDGEIGEDILHNALVIPSIPNRIEAKGNLTIDGEIICTYQNFNQHKIKNYSNPRNFAAGSIRLLSSEECAKRHLSFVAWDLISIDYVDDISNLLVKNLHGKLFYLESLGFTVVPYEILSNNQQTLEKIENVITNLVNIAKEKEYPIDGIVVKIDHTDTYNKLGYTDHHFRGGIAFKFTDDLYETTLKEIQWTMGRTGILTPIALFNPVEIDGANIERASLHNVDILQQIMGHYCFSGQKINIFRANQIIPQVQSAEHKNDNKDLINNTFYLDTFHIDKYIKCPYCGADTIITTSNNNVHNLVCSNPNCESKIINQLEHFCGKKGLDIKGLSKATLNKLINWGWITSALDIFTLNKHREDWIKKEGFGIKSVDNILNAIEYSRNCSLSAFISALGIPLIGKTVAKKLCEKFFTYEELRDAINDNYDFCELPDFGESKKSALLSYDFSIADQLIANKDIHIQKEEKINIQENSALMDKIIVITGKLHSFKNRNELKEKIESLGGKVSNNITNKTFCLVNNDIESMTAKNKAAKEKDIPIISEENFIKNYLQL